MIILSLRRGDEDKLIDELIWKSLWIKKEREVNKGKKQTKIQFFRMKESQINFVNSSASKKKLHSQAGNKLNQARKIKSIFIMIQERTNLFFSSSSLFLQSLLKSCQAAAGIFQIWCLFVSPMPRQFSYFSSHRLLTLFPYLNVSPVYFPGVFSYISQIPDFSSFLIQPVVLHCLIYLSQIPPVFLLQLYSAFPFEIFVEISY